LPDRQPGRYGTGKETRMFPRHTPPTIRKPFANYAHGIEVPPGARWLVCSGQLGIRPDDSIPEDSEAQAALCFENIGAILHSAGMDFGDIVRLNAYVTGREHLAGYMRARDRYVTSPPPASTLMIVSGFANPAFHVEIEALAAKVD
jgi:enamine deaminase RidA (YjgF/YER057c/UK114 family)